MSFGKNLQFLRKMHNSMTQEELAERMGVSRQTISKWESETAYPEKMGGRKRHIRILGTCKPDYRLGFSLSFTGTG